MSLKVVEGDGRPEGARSWQRALLLGSLMLNLLLIGAIGGGLWAARHRGPHGLQRIEQGFFGYVKSLPRERATALLNASEAQRQTLRGQRKALRERRSAALALLAQEPLDKEKLKAALSSIAEAEAGMERTGEDVFIDLVGRLTPEERKGYVGWRLNHDGPERGRSGEKAAGK